MNSRERVITALNHAEPDCIPFDLGGTVVNGIHIRAYQALRKYLNLPEVKPRIADVFQQIAQADVPPENIWRCGRLFKSSAYITARSWFFWMSPRR